MSSCNVVQVVPGSEQITSERELLVQPILLHGNYEHHKWFLFTFFVCLFVCFYVCLFFVLFFVQKCSSYCMEISSW